MNLLFSAKSVNLKKKKIDAYGTRHQIGESKIKAQE